MNPVLALLLKAVVVAALGAIAVLAGSPLVQKLFERVDPPRPADDGSQQPPPAEAPGVVAAEDTLQGGRWIGMLERLAAFASVLAGFPEGIAVVLAIKGLARYPELKATTRGTAERFIIGTFASVLFAVACSGLAWWLIGLW
ncbi:MAG: hypothetical protein VB080_14660 [Propionicimonas sp.]|uniref:hypothetical protein n=1 Tax=Propionicimonas sp. TaxID=1955623 RepID=UPI002B204C84|nr:hypothetical protein [Propionicimonas sp.]MEA4945662.1 hypothetical protein [Propionicimonas sp.]MEA5054454.1 hypothetical protein [Propionicimonas sp.]